MKHTPGPWTASEGFPSDVWHVDMEGRLFSVVVSRSDQPETVMPVSEVKANARLMAAAPELLEALEYMLDACEAHGVSDNDFPIQLARTAIRLTTGGE